MRIIGGSFRGTTLFAPEGRNTRPTTDRVRENIFNVLQGVIEGRTVLDAFAGSGAMSLEAVSRGAVAAVLLEKDKKAQAAIKRNIAACRAEQQVRLYSGDTLRLLSQLKAHFDLVFLDPPYNRGLVGEAERLLLQYSLLAEGAVVVLETASKQGECLNDDRLSLVKETVYGDTCVLYYRFSEVGTSEEEN